MVAQQNGLATISPQEEEWNDARREFIRKNFCGGAPDSIASTFLALCERRRLSPEARHVYLVNRAKKGDPPNWVIQTGIDGYRLIAARTERYAGSDDPSFEYNEQGRIIRSTVTVRKLVGGQLGSFTASARMDEYAAGSPMWGKMPHTMIAKCAEALALRKAFPEELSGMYTDAEMDQAESPPARARVVDHTTGEIIDAASEPYGYTDSGVPTGGGPEFDMITQAQLRKLHVLKNQKGLTDDGIKKLHGKASAKNLTKREATALIDELSMYPDIILDEPDDAEYVEPAELFDASNPDRYTQ